MTVIRPNSISGINSITAQGGDINFYRADGSASDLTINNIVGAAATFTGVLSYEDVTNVDSVGIITARTGVIVGSGVTLNSTGVIATGVVTATSFVGSGANLTGITVGGGYKNLIINGGMLVAQRKPTGEIQFSGYGSVDRFANRYGGTDEAPNQYQFDVGASDSGDNPYDAGITKTFRIRNGNQTSVGTSDYLLIQYRPEAQDIRNSGWDYTNPNSYITFSYYVRSSIAQNFYVTFKTNDGTPQKYAMETGSLTADTWKRVTHTIPGNSNLQFDANADEGLEIEWSLFRGTDQTGSMSLNSWAANNNSVRTPDQTNTWYDTNNSTFDVTGVQLEVGSSVTPFENRTFADELLRCQRYCFRLGGSIGGDSEIYTTLAFGIHANATVAKCQIIHPVTMRSKDVEFSVSNITLDDDVASYNSGNYSSINSVQSSSSISTLVLNTANYGAGAGRVTRVLVSTAGGYIQGETEL
mgnify:CR=1 FL=1